MSHTLCINHPSSDLSTPLAALRRAPTRLQRGLAALALAAAALLGLAPTAWAAVDANAASQADLETVTGIGPSLSAKILAERGKGPFKDWTDLVDRVRGVGPGSAARLSANGLTVGGQGYSAAAEAAAPARPSSRRAATEGSGMAEGVAMAAADGRRSNRSRSAMGTAPAPATGSTHAAP